MRNYGFENLISDRFVFKETYFIYVAKTFVDIYMNRNTIAVLPTYLECG